LREEVKLHNELYSDRQELLLTGNDRGVYFAKNSWNLIIDKLNVNFFSLLFRKKLKILFQKITGKEKHYEER
jgi:hypothetical protein